MLEFFAITALAEHMKNKKEEEDARMKEYFNQESKIKVVITETPVNTPAMNFLAGILALVIAIFTAKLAYNCNLKSDVVVRVLATLFGFFFSGLYLVYYFVRYLVLGQKC